VHGHVEQRNDRMNGRQDRFVNIGQETNNARRFMGNMGTRLAIDVIRVDGGSLDCNAIKGILLLAFCAEQCPSLDPSAPHPNSLAQLHSEGLYTRWEIWTERMIWKGRS